MPTVILTATCPNACPWCFARSKMDAYVRQGITEMPWQNFLRVVEFYERSGTRRMNLLGGEPTLHSRFIETLDLLESRQFSIQVVTNGIMQPSLVDTLRERRFSRVSFFLNSTSYFEYDPERRSRVDYMLARLGYPISISYTISERDVTRPSIDPVLDRIAMITRYALRRHLQTQIAVPAAGNRSFIPFHKYGTLLDLLASWAAILHKNGFTSGLDCHSIPRCAASGEDGRHISFKSTCSEFMIDIGPDLSVWPCYPLSDETFRLDEFDSFSDIYRRFREVAAARTLVYEERCNECEHRLTKSCDCGCWGFQRLRRPVRLASPSATAADEARKGSGRPHGTSLRLKPFSVL